MTLTIHTEEDDQRQLKVTVEVPEERVQTQMRRTARTLARQVRIPGFRKGKVPYGVLLNRLGQKAVRGEAVEDMIEPLVEEALEQVEATPYRQPTLDDMEIEPLVLKMTIPLEPTIVLGDYRAIRKDLQPVEVTGEAVDEAIERIRESHQETEPEERPVELGDMVTLTGEGKTEEEESQTVWHEHEAEWVMNPEKSFPDTPFVENIVGLSAGDTKEFRFVFPDDYDDEDLAGKEAVFEVTVEEVKSLFVPEMTDDLAKEEGDYESVDELREEISKDLFNHAEQQARSDMLEEMLDNMLEEAEIVYPPVVVEAELDGRLESFKERITNAGWQWEDFTRLQGMTEESLREEWREDAVNQVRRGLVLHQFAEEEKLKVESSDSDAEVEQRVAQFGEDAETQDQIRNIFTQGPGLEMVSNDILMEKIQDRVEAIVTGNAPDLEALEEDEPSAGDQDSEEEE